MDDNQQKIHINIKLYLQRPDERFKILFMDTLYRRQ